MKNCLRNTDKTLRIKIAPPRERAHTNTRTCASRTRNETEESGNAVTPVGNPFMGAARKYFSEKIHWVDESLASKQAARGLNFRCNFRAGIRAIRAQRRSRKRRGGGGASEGGRERGGREGEKIVRREIGSASPTYNRQRVEDPRLLDLRQSNFANETYPVTQLAARRALTHVRAYARTRATSRNIVVR